LAAKYANDNWPVDSIIFTLSSTSPDEDEVEINELMLTLQSERLVTQKERIVHAAHDISTHFSNLLHFSEFVRVAGDQIEEGKTFELFRLLVRHLDYLVVPLT